ncbi:MAG: hypothetical protein ABWY20_19370 [Mycobacterium sp.]
MRAQARRGANVTGARVTTLAAIAKVPPERMWDLMQQHRLAQRRGRTRFILTAKGYGKQARWYITRADNTQRTHDALRGACNVLLDAATRCLSDWNNEVRPSLIDNPESRRIETVYMHTLNVVRAQVDLAEQLLAP